MKNSFVFQSFLILVTVIFTCAWQGEIHAETIPADSKILFVGTGASEYESCFMGTYDNDSTVNFLNITASSLDVSNVLTDFYQGRTSAAAKNNLLRKLDEEYDYIVFIPREDNVQTKPELFMEAARLIKSYTEAMGTRLVIPMIWDGSNAAAHTDTFEEHTYRVCDALNLDCVPAGLAWKNVLTDATVAASDSSPGGPSGYAVYTLAATVFAHFFEQKVDSSAYNQTGVSLAERSAIADSAYAAWDAAATATHYTGEYTSSFCTPWSTPHDMGNRNWASMGTSTEYRTNMRLKTIIERAGATYRGVEIKGYNYDGPDRSLKLRYFGDILNSTPDEPGITPVQDLVAADNYDFCFGRLYSETKDDYSMEMSSLHALDPDSGGDTQFVFFNKHYVKQVERVVEGVKKMVWVGDSAGTIHNIAYHTGLMATAARNHPDIQAIPNYIAFGRLWQERPTLTIIQDDDQHLTPLGSYLQAGMIYTLVTGGEHPASDYPDWTEDEKYILDLAYETVISLGGLKNVSTEVPQVPPTVEIISPADGQEIAGTQGVTVKVDARHAGGIDRVRLTLDGVNVDRLDRIFPYQWDLGMLTPGDHTLMARAFAEGGEVATTDVLTFRVSGNAGDEEIVLLSPATADPSIIPINGNIILSVLARDSNGDELSYIWDRDSVFGQVSIQDPFSATTNGIAMQVGTHVIDVKISDGVNEITSSVTVTVIPPGPILPEAQSQTLDVHWGRKLAITLSGTPVGAELSYQVVAGPNSGVLSGEPPNLEYSPNPDFKGTDEFTFKVTDGDSNSDDAIVTINVTNEKPTGINETLVVPVDGFLDITLNGADGDGDPLTYEIQTAPQSGTVTDDTTPDVIYTPNAGFIGTDEMTYRIFDGLEYSDTITIHLNIEAVDDSSTGFSGDDDGDDDGGCGGCSTTSDNSGTAWLLVLSILGMVACRRFVRLV